MAHGEVEGGRKEEAGLVSKTSGGVLVGVCLRSRAAMGDRDKGSG